jgi:hypothetical protein
MLLLLPACLLVACATSDSQTGGEGDGPRVVRQVELASGMPSSADRGLPARKTFNRQGVQGWLDDTGAWQASAEVPHGRLRCGTYEIGLQLGQGTQGCNEVEWFTDVQYVTRLRHCNSATRLHAGGGLIGKGADRFAKTSCVRLVVRCEGHCGAPAATDTGGRSTPFTGY